jgi:hypothetical protein
MYYMEMYTWHFCLNIFDIFKYVENAFFQIKGAYAPGSQNAMPLNYVGFIILVFRSASS